MTGTLLSLVFAMLLFVGSHLALSAGPLRDPLVARIGEKPFRGLYSALSLLLLGWVALAYRDAPVIDAWIPPIGLQHLALLIMPAACVLLVAGLSTRNPLAIGGDGPGMLKAGPTGILKVTRHPVMWAFALWGIAHLLANGDLASMLLFGGITLLALVGAGAQEAKKRRRSGSDWQAFAARTSYLPFAAVLGGRSRLSFAEIGWWRIALGLVVFALLLWLHPWLFSVSPLPL